MHKKHSKTRGVFFWLGIAVAAGIGVLLVMTAIAASTLPTTEEIINRQVPQSTKIYDRTGTILLYETGGAQKRTVIPYQDIPQYLKDATVAIEDERFYEEPAFDIRGIARAVYVDLVHGGTVQGASTITQQLARNAFLSNERSLMRKLKELLLAIKLNKYYTKDQILELYLNEIPYGPTAYGVQSASQLYFGRDVHGISLAQAAVLAALPKAPTYFSPWGTHAKELMARERLVLTKMYDLGKITRTQEEEALAEHVAFQPQSQGGIKAPHFSFTVQDYLVQKYGEDAVQTGGLRVVTTLDWDLEREAETAVAEGAARNLELYHGTNAALVAQDPKTGQILALVGSKDFFNTADEGNFNVATQGLRQPGSSLKPFVYMTAFEKGYTADTVLFDVPTEFSTDPACPAAVNFSNADRRCFHPQNYDGTFRGPISLRNALAQSVNVPSVKTLYLAGMQSVISNTEAMGITTLTNPSQYGLSLVLGGGAVHLIDLVEAYSVLSQEGVRHAQNFILEVKDSQGRWLESYQDSATQVVDPQYPRLVNDILTDLDARAPLFHASLSATTVPGYQIALKTGTSNDYRDAWAFGYTPNLVAGVWAGNNNNAAMQRQGGSILAAVPIWHAFMIEALKKYPSETFIPPAPAAPAKPVLAGDYVPNAGGVHSILYYVDRNDPAGSPPANPGADPQFGNWESAIQNWLKDNAISSSSISSARVSGQNTVHIGKPMAGDTINGPVQIEASISLTSPISLIKIYFNGAPVNQIGGSFGRFYNLAWSFTPQAVNSQNTIAVEAVDSTGVSTQDTVIVYH